MLLFTLLTCSDHSVRQLSVPPFLGLRLFASHFAVWMSLVSPVASMSSSDLNKAWSGVRLSVAVGCDPISNRHALPIPERSWRLAWFSTGSLSNQRARRRGSRRAVGGPWGHQNSHVRRKRLASRFVSESRIFSVRIWCVCSFLRVSFSRWFFRDWLVSFRSFATTDGAPSKHEFHSQVWFGLEDDGAWGPTWLDGIVITCCLSRRRERFSTDQTSVSSSTTLQNNATGGYPEIKRHTRTHKTNTTLGYVSLGKGLVAFASTRPLQGRQPKDFRLGSRRLHFSKWAAVAKSPWPQRLRKIWDLSVFFFLFFQRITCLEGQVFQGSWPL